MKLPKLNWSIVILVFGICLSLLAAGYWLWQQNAIERPLIEKLRQVPGVRDVMLHKGHAGLRIELIADPAIDFGQAAPLVQDLLKAAPKQTEVVWRKQCGQELIAVRQSLSFILREAQVRHEYVAMAERIHTSLCTDDVSYQISVDERAIYLKLRQGDQIWLEVLPVIGIGGADQ